MTLVLITFLILIIAGIVFAYRLSSSDVPIGCAKVLPGDSFVKVDPGLDGYDDAQRVQVLAVTAALAVGASDGAISRGELCVIKGWMKRRLGFAGGSGSFFARWHLGQQLSSAVQFFKSGNQVDIKELCKQIAAASSPADRYNMLEFFLYVVRSNKTISAGQVKLLYQISDWLEADRQKFRLLAEKILPVNKYADDDQSIDMILGLEPDMDADAAKAHLNSQYGKWNARTASNNPAVRTQAAEMLKLIGRARAVYAN